MSPIVLSKYPYSNAPDAPVIAPQDPLQWTTIPGIDIYDPRFESIPTVHLRAFTKSYHYNALSDADKKYIASLTPELLAPAECTDLSNRASYMEQVRSNIPATGLLQEALSVVKNGTFSDGTPVKSSDRANMLLRLFDKALPNAKNVDGLLMQQKEYENRIAKEATKQEDIKKLTREQLLERIIMLERSQSETTPTHE